ncbi:hypothetical protein [Brucella intermedia]|uniref:hypothetical protein n=1 Tax=Brucella intermedia TaxID=94625 RepID=UPI00124C98C6|nr:hypothetical protein [Brucella intermedia]KAB2733638.1 hypothetical protein F9L02_01285 [Brucella intermedia]
MADLRLRINELPEELNPAPIDNIAIDGPSTRRTTLQLAADAVRPYSTEAMAREGLNNASAMTPLRVSQAIETLGGQRFATAQQGNRADTAVQPTLTISAGAGLAGGGTLAANREIALNSASIASLALANSAVQPSRQVIAGVGLTGGGSLAADRTVSLDATTLASLAKADSAVQPARAISAGTGLTGGGNLSADRTLALNAASVASLAKADSAVQPTRSVSAGAGLSGGGDLSADRSLSLSPATQASLAKADSAIQAPGGTAGQVLAKASSNPNDVGWVNIEGATAVSYGPQTLTAEQKTQARTNIDAFAIPTGTTAQYLRGDGSTAAMNKAAVGLGNVDNTSDVNKPVSTAMQTALNAKANLNGGAVFTGGEVGITGNNLRLRGSIPNIYMTTPGQGYAYTISANMSDTVYGTWRVQAGFGGASLIEVAGSSGNVTVAGAFSAASKSFKTDHPLDPYNKDIVYVSTESPSHGIEYWGAVRLVGGRAIIDVDSHYGMTPGTFQAMTKDSVLFFQNQDSGKPVYRRWLEDGTFEVICDDVTCTDLIGWQVKGIRQDAVVFTLPHTDTETGHLIPEQDKPDYVENANG